MITEINQTQFCIPASVCIMISHRLSLECDEDEGLHFSYPASTLLQETEVATL